MTMLGRHIIVPNAGQTRVFSARGTAAAGNWWDVAGVTCIAAYQAKGAASYAATLANLANPGTYTPYEGAAPTWDTSTGWGFAESSWLFIASLPYVALDWTIMIRGTVGSNGSTLFSALDNAEASAVRLFITNYIYCSIGGSTNQAIASSGVYPDDDVVAMAGVQSYINGTPGPAITEASAKTSVRGCIGANWPGYGPYTPLTGTIMAVAIWSSVLSEAQVGAVTSAMAAL